MNISDPQTFYINRLESKNENERCHLSYDKLQSFLKQKQSVNEILSHCNETKCKPGEYMCIFHKYCIGIEYLCDGINDCLHGDDELFCSKPKF